MGQEFIQIFSEMGWIAATLLSVGIVFCVIEIFVPGIGFFGVSGAGAIVLGIIFRCVNGVSLYQLIVLLLLIFGIFVLAVLCLIILIKMGVMGDVGIFNTGTALPKDYGNNKEYKKLVGKIGKTTTEMTLAGRVKVRGKIYDAISEENYIDKNKLIKVVRLEDNRLVVRKYWE